MSGWPKTTSYKERRCVLDSTSFVCYSVPTFKRAASSMAEQETLNFKVQGSTPWQPTSHTISQALSDTSPNMQGWCKRLSIAVSHL